MRKRNLCVFCAAGLIVCSAAIIAAFLVLKPRAHAVPTAPTAASTAVIATATGMLSQADIDVLSETANELQLEFTDATGVSTTVTFDLVTEDGHTFWKTRAPLRQTAEFAFGNTSPSLPTIVRLRGRGIEPADVVKPLTSAIAQDTFDDLTIYQGWQGEVIVALHNDDMVTSIYHAGLWYWYSTARPINPPPNWLCDGWKAACCNGHISSCVSAFHLCGQQMAGQVCTCMQNRCQNGDGAACNMWYCCCGQQNPLECCDNEVVDILKIMGDLIALKE